MSGNDAHRPVIFGLTGSIGMGKSTVAAMFRDAGIPVFDADAEVHRLQAAGGALLPAIEAAFPGTTGPAGVDRQLLGATVLGDADKLARLEAIVHPAVRAARQAFLDTHRNLPLIVFDIPLLFEKGGHAEVDRIVVVSAPTATQRARVLARPGMSERRYADILALQTPDALKRAGADHVIDTGATMEQTRAEVIMLIEKLRGLPAQPLRTGPQQR